MSKLSLLAVFQLIMLVNAFNITTTLTKQGSTSTVTRTHFSENVKESESYSLYQNQTETIGVPYVNAHFSTGSSSAAQASGYSNVTYSNELASATDISSSESSSESQSSSTSLDVVTTTKVQTQYSVANPYNPQSTYEPAGGSQSDADQGYPEISQSRIAIGTTKKVVTLTTQLTSTPSAEVILVTTTATTKTSTIYTASVTGIYSEQGARASPVPTTASNPLFTNSQVSEAQTNSIATSSFTKDRTITVSTTSTSSIASNSASYSGKGSSHTSISGAASISGTTISSVGYHNSSIPYESLSSSALDESSSILSGSSLSQVASSSENVTATLSSSELSRSTELESSLSGSSSSSSSLLESSSSVATSSSASNIDAAGAVSSSHSVSVSATGTTTLQTTSQTPEATSFNLFSAIDTQSPPNIFKREALPLELPEGVESDDKPIETNKFWGNLILSKQTDGVWTYPYGFFKSVTDYYGFAVSHTNSSQYVFGNYDSDGTAEYYFNPIGLGSFIFSAKGFTEDNLGMDISEMKSMSTLVTLFNNQSSPDSDFIDLSLVQGMGFATAVYNGNLTPLLNSNVGFAKLVQETSTSLDSKIQKYRASLNNGVDWLLYVTLPSSSTDFKLSATGSFAITGSKAVDGLIIQVAVAPSSNEAYYDQAAGTYVTDATVQGSSNGVSANYQFKYATKGQSSSGNPIVFALPHHLKSFTSATTRRSTGISLDSSTKGTMYAYLTDYLQFSDSFNNDVQWLPWSQQITKDLSYTADQLKLIASVANDELNVDFASSVKGLGMYTAGKFLDKYAYMLLVIDEIIQDDSVRNSTLERLKDAFDIFLQNEQEFSLMYDTRYKGVTSTAAQNGDTGADYGGPYYNDHHFHYGYFVHAAAVIGYVDAKQGGSWAQDNKDWVNSLVRDVANPTDDDSYFPVSRSFDWFAGHSWAAGLFTAGDGKNEESTSEDYNFAYGMKLWGNVIGDQSMEARGNLMISILAKSLNDYFLFSDDNDIQPNEIIGNKVSGILFDNKVDYTTWFGTNKEYIHGIHMLPITPVSSVIRGPNFVKQEWDQKISSIVDTLNSGWTGILRLNQALTDPKASYNFFSQDNFSNTWLDNGLSRTWCLAFSGGLVNSL
ncbi:putative secreted protein [Wickerhamomyces ciferrii]|uniref:Glucan endo-1,3-beta-D-glucosidase 1 n=1 Tax=Wickerhamomyces ciferrii (strain ATCC 14091 / BCRC 22168 / CBS 111 / JCM 3599 / NBRC 0793 / NRRL Y-1031 F-60-10) TaxID=1206466 RepID=K0KHA5_WICCF|nr:uncharacterized protein BN7_1926 [Wickerhamomyces ciferrii]CCH42381.1 putative secreted protein [Wickerhamomyces ciferrii]